MTLGAWLALASCLALAAPARASDGVALFEKRIRPVLVERCYGCHSAGAKQVKGGLRLDTRAAVLAGGHEGPAVVPGDPDKSLLVRAIRYDDEALQMPPDEDKRLSPDEVRDFEEWVRRGAPDPREGAPEAPAITGRDPAEIRNAWPFRPPVRPPLPAVKDTRWSAHPVDLHLLARMEARGLAPVADADRPTLIRRATFDLTGLPPTPEEIAAFLADRRPDAWARLVERLLASPHYGERWGRHWLDVARYADTAGDNSDFPIPQLYRYRNWVIRAFNDDKPYDEMVREQIAGDLLVSRSRAERFDKIVATGYLANARRFGSNLDDYPWHLTIEDTIDNLGRTFLGLSVSCARCHDHKFDPITAEDYYGLYGILQSTRYPWPGIEVQKYQRDLVPLADDERVDLVMRARAARLAPIEEEIARLDKRRQELDAAAKAAAGQPGNQAAEAGSAARKVGKEIDELRKREEAIARERLPFETAYAVSEAARAEDASLQVKGDPTRAGKKVPRGFLQILGGQRLPPRESGSGRLALARWLASGDNPLTARVMVNRIWLHHFGKGIVGTPNDFGRQGRPASHPELLDHLAVEFVERGWSVKAMHRLIMSSRSYRLSSQHDDRGMEVDPTNESFWRFNRRRLDAESIRDTLLALSGSLDRTPGGEHPFPPPDKWDYTQHKPFRASYETSRRSVYVMSQRTTRDPYLSAFDGADPNASTPVRVTSTTSLQALYFMNSSFVHEQAQRFAARLAREARLDRERIRRAFWLAFGRRVTAEEERAAIDHLKQVERTLAAEPRPLARRRVAAWESLARALFRTSELIHVR